MSVLTELRPTEHARIYDLVREAGHDVSDWVNYSKGDTSPAANPRYCYEWVYEQPNRPTIVTLCFRHLQEKDGRVVWSQNPMQWTNPSAKSGQRQNWSRRAQRFVDAIRRTGQEGIPLRVIVVDGEQRDVADPDAAASNVRWRRLDPVPWSVTSFDEATSFCVLTRDIAGRRATDQFALDPEGRAIAERIDKNGTAFARDSKVRELALARAQGRCEYCGQVGFMLPDGARFLETHHIIPLSEGGADTVANVAALCPNHHREAHHGERRETIRNALLRVRNGRHS